MKAEEKAKELIEVFYAPDSTSVEQDLHRAKHNALICVDEMIMQNGKYYLSNGGKLTDEIYRKENAFLFDVKQAIQNHDTNRKV